MEFVKPRRKKLKLTKEDTELLLRVWDKLANSWGLTDVEKERLSRVPGTRRVSYRRIINFVRIDQALLRLVGNTANIKKWLRNNNNTQIFSDLEDLLNTNSSTDKVRKMADYLESWTLY